MGFEIDDATRLRVDENIGAGRRAAVVSLEAIVRAGTIKVVGPDDKDFGGDQTCRFFFEGAESGNCAE